MTIAGESAGGGPVLVMLTSPLARPVPSCDLAISRHSQSPRQRNAITRPCRRESIAIDFARAVGINGDDTAALAELRALPPATLNKDAEQYQAAAIDGRLMVEVTEIALRAGRNGGGRPQWPRYDLATRDVLSSTNAGVKFGSDPLKARLDLWRSVWEPGR